jgi:integrase/recombinase XerD
MKTQKYVPKYTFSDKIIKELARLEIHLKENKYKIDTIKQYKNCTGIYLTWLDANNYLVAEVTYKVLIDFIQESQQIYSINQVRRIIIAIKHYHDSLDNPINPVTGIFIKGQRKSIINEIINYNHIRESYDKFEALDDRGKRNKVLLSLMIYQALTTEDLHILEPGHIRLKEGKIYIPKHNKINGRILDLDASQMLLLQEYLLVIRPNMLANVNGYRGGRKVNKISPIIYDKLFFSELGSTNIKASLQQIFRSIKKQYPKIESGKIIRTTVIAEWLKTIDIRKVQYMAGHRYVSSTERYNAMNLEELKDSLNRYHPLK